MQEKLEPKGEKTIAASAISIFVGLVLLALLATSFLSSVGLELTNEADDVSVGAGFVLLGGIIIAWLYAGLRVYNRFFGKTQTETK